MKLLLAIAAGGAVGALGRHAVSYWSLKWFGPGFPWGTLAVNVIGALAMGLLIELFALRGGVSNEARAFLTVGVLGAFTTFSTFALDVATLSQRKELLLAGVYVASSVSLAILALFAGLALARSLL